MTNALRALGATRQQAAGGLSGVLWRTYAQAVTSDLRSVLRLKAMARTAAESGGDVGSYPTEADAIELIAAYVRLRDEASKIHERAGWGIPEEFAADLPPLDGFAPTGIAPRYLLQPDPTPALINQTIERGVQARFRLLQLAAWAEGHQEAFEIEEQMRANAVAKVAAAERAPRPPVGFSDRSD